MEMPAGCDRVMSCRSCKKEKEYRIKKRVTTAVFMTGMPVHDASLSPLGACDSDRDRHVHGHARDSSNWT